MRFLFTSLLAVILFLGCADMSVKKKEASISLDGKEWKLVSFGKIRMAVPKKSWISFKDGRYSGYAGCNGMGGEYVVDGNNMTLKAGMSTMMACADMRLETKFRQSMLSVDSYKIEGDNLILMHDNHDVLNFMIK